MKKIIYALTLILATAAISCGDDDPVIPRDRDIEFNTFELFHIAGATPTASIQSCHIVLHRKGLKADITINVNINGDNLETFNLTDLPLTYNEDSNHYSINVSSTNIPRISNMKAIIDCNDYIADIVFLLDGKQVTGTSNELFYSKTSTVLKYDNSTSYTDLYATYIYELHPEGSAATLKIGNLTHSKDVLNYKNITLEGLKMDVTGSGYRITGDAIETTKGQYSRYDASTGSPTTNFGDSLFLRFENIEANLDVANSSMTGSWTMVRLKRVTDTIQKTPEIRTQQRIVEVNRTRIDANGKVY